tara:strand:- start:264 stop:1739 length:1476 start_codon:yes stop_codon:yes gene_type:complete
MPARFSTTHPYPYEADGYEYMIIPSNNIAGFHCVSYEPGRNGRNPRPYSIIIGPGRSRTKFTTAFEAHIAYLKYIGPDENKKLAEQHTPPVPIGPRPQDRLTPDGRTIIPVSTTTTAGYYGVEVSRSNPQRPYKILIGGTKRNPITKHFKCPLEAHLAKLEHLGPTETARIARRLDPTVTITIREEVLDDPTITRSWKIHEPDNTSNNTRHCHKCDEWKDIDTEFPQAQPKAPCNSCEAIWSNKHRNTWIGALKSKWRSMHKSSTNRKLPPPDWKDERTYLEWAVDQLEMRDHCAYNIEIKLTPQNISPERVDESKGYSPSNTIFIQSKLQSRGGKNQWSRGKWEFIPWLKAAPHLYYNEESARADLARAIAAESRTEPGGKPWYVKRKGDIDSSPLLTFVMNQYNNSISTTKRRNSNRKHRELDHTILVSDILEMWIEQMGRCEILGIPMTPRANSPWLMSLDRRNDGVGYTRENCRLIVVEMNTPKCED